MFYKGVGYHRAHDYSDTGNVGNDKVILTKFNSAS